jgi:hypothetical protein
MAHHRKEETMGTDSVTRGFPVEYPTRHHTLSQLIADAETLARLTELVAIALVQGEVARSERDDELLRAVASASRAYVEAVYDRLMAIPDAYKADSPVERLHAVPGPPRDGGAA